MTPQPERLDTADSSQDGAAASESKEWTSVPSGATERLVMIRETLYTPVIGDILDTLGRRHQFLPPDIRAIVPGTVLAGRAMPVLISDVVAPSGRPFGRLTEALDDLKLNEIYLARGGRTEVAAWGEILTEVALHNGAVGAVIDGYHRDTRKVIAKKFPVFSRGAYGQDAGVRTAVVDFRLPTEIEGVSINPGDLVVGDWDGVVVVPQDVEDEVLDLALQKVSTENNVLQAIREGMTATEAYGHFGVL